MGEGADIAAFLTDALIARGLVPGSFAIASADPKAPAEGLIEPEDRFIEKAVEKRRREFAAGRRAARKALKELGLQEAAIPANADRSPSWPEGLVGSISHSEEVCLALLAPALIYRYIGLDVEPNQPLEQDLWPIVLSDREQRWINGFDQDKQGLLAKQIFSAKESVFKAQFPMTKAMLEFRDVEIEFGEDVTAFSAQIKPSQGEASLGEWVGHIILFEDMVVSAMLIVN